jgi:hypothetical protein
MPDIILKSRLEITGLNSYKTQINSPWGSEVNRKFSAVRF